MAENQPKRSGDHGDMNRPSQKNIWTLIVNMLVSAIVGGVASAFAVQKITENQYMNTNDGVISNSGKPGTTKISNQSVKSTSPMTKAFNKNKDAVVSVVNLQKQSKSQDDIFSSLFGNLYGNNDDSSNSDSKDKSKLEENSEGSGVIYSKQDGKAYIVTNNHVVSGSDKLEIILSSGKKVNAKLVGKDKVSDLAVISIDAKYADKTATFGNSDALQPAQTVIAIGSPLGSQYATSVTQGIISAKNRTVSTTDSETGQQTGEQTVIQTDAAINPGNSGGPLVNVAGQVIGINSMKMSASTDGSSVEGMGFAIPSNEVVKVINQLVQNGKVVRPSLGIKVVDLDQISTTQQKKVLKLPSNVNKGVLIASVSNGSVADKAGLKKYDVIVAMDGKSIQNTADLHNVLYSKSIGQTVQIKYYRGSDLHTTTAHLTKEN